MAKFGFNTNDYDPSDRDFEVMPKGEYTLKGVEAEDKETKNGDGTYIAATFEVVKGEYAGRKIWQNFNVTNPNEKAEKIGREQITGWARACGKPNAQDTDELLERPFQCKLGIEKGTGGYSDKNKIDSFLIPGQESKASKPADKPKSKFDDEAPAKKPAPKEEVEEIEGAEEKPEPKKEAPAGKKKNPWD